MGNRMDRARQEASEFLSEVSGVAAWKKKRRIRALFALDGLQDAAAGVRRNASESAERTRGLFRLAFGKRRMRPLPTDSEDGRERWRVACEVHGRAPGYAQEVVRVTHRAALFWLCAASVAGALALYATLFGLCLAVVSGGLMFRSAFWNWQARRESLDAVGAFLSRPSEWWPSPAAGRSEQAVFIGTPGKREE
jgi:hypothetical protein